MHAAIVQAKPRQRVKGGRCGGEWMNDCKAANGDRITASPRDYFSNDLPQWIGYSREIGGEKNATRYGIHVALRRRQVRTAQQPMA